MKVQVDVTDVEDASDAIYKAVDADIDTIQGLNHEERLAVAEIRHGLLMEAVELCVEADEGTTIEFDTETLTARVVTG